ncbi:MAG: SRPBCC domain-containing protein [Gammaproteobacteria bacterium]|nr:SRPBCC domain-containing protein [Gammaproteobacteria bacterium]
MGLNFDAAEHLEAVERRVFSPERDGDPAHAATLSRRFGAPARQMWNAVTDPERLRRWFMPVSGELRLGGRYQFEGNAGGTITACQPPSFLAVTWEFAGDVSWVEVLVSNDGANGGRLTLTHTYVQEFPDPDDPTGYLRRGPGGEIPFTAVPDGTGRTLTWTLTVGVAVPVRENVHNPSNSPATNFSVKSRNN